MKISEMQRKLLELWMEGVLVIKSYELNFQGLETVKRVEVGDEEVVEAVTEGAAVGMTGEMIADEMTMAVENMAVNDSHSLIRDLHHQDPRTIHRGDTVEDAVAHVAQ